MTVSIATSWHSAWESSIPPLKARYRRRGPCATYITPESGIGKSSCIFFHNSTRILRVRRIYPGKSH